MSNNKYPIIFNVNFRDKTKLAKDNNNRINNNRKKLTLSSKVDYLQRDVGKQGIDEVFQKSDKWSGYISRPSSKVFGKFENENDQILYFNSAGAVLKGDIVERKKIIDQLDQLETNDNFCYYESIISFNKDLENVISKNLTQEDLYNIIKKEIPKFMEKNGMSMKNIEYAIAFHTNTKHLHAHFDFWEKKPTKVRNKLKLENFDYFKKNLLLNIDSNFKIKYDKLIQEKNNEFGKFRKLEINNDIYSTIIIDVLKEKNYPNYKSIKNQELKKAIDIKANQLNDCLDKNCLKKLKELNGNFYNEKKANQLMKKELERIDLEIKNHILKYYKNIIKTEDLKKIKINNYAVQEIEYVAEKKYKKKSTNEKYKKIYNEDVEYIKSSKNNNEDDPFRFYRKSSKGHFKNKHIYKYDITKNDNPICKKNMLDIRRGMKKKQKEIEKELEVANDKIWNERD